MTRRFPKELFAVGATAGRCNLLAVASLSHQRAMSTWPAMPSQSKTTEIRFYLDLRRQLGGCKPAMSATRSYANQFPLAEPFGSILRGQHPEEVAGLPREGASCPCERRSPGRAGEASRYRWLWMTCWAQRGRRDQRLTGKKRAFGLAFGGSALANIGHGKILLYELGRSNSNIRP